MGLTRSAAAPSQPRLAPLVWLVGADHRLSSSILVHATLLIPASIAFEATLSFLGRGIVPPTPDWGGMLAEARPPLRRGGPAGLPLAALARAELDDVLAGARWSYGAGLVPAGKPAVMGSSYGGYLSAVAACTRGAEIAAAVVHAGISDIASCRHTANNAPFWDILLGGPPHDPEVRQLYIEIVN